MKIVNELLDLHNSREGGNLFFDLGFMTYFANSFLLPERDSGRLKRPEVSCIYLFCHSKLDVDSFEN